MTLERSTFSDTLMSARPAIRLTFHGSEMVKASVYQLRTPREPFSELFAVRKADSEAAAECDVRILFLMLVEIFQARRGETVVAQNVKTFGNLRENE